MPELPPPHVQRLIDKLQRALPLQAHVRSELIASSRTHFAIKTQTLRCTVTHIYYLDEARGPMCQIDFERDALGSNLFVLPIAHLSFEHGRPIAREIALYRKRRLESLAEKRRAARNARRIDAPGVPI
ncbi:MAG: hypothetical protein C3F11_13285 [Methylocystaceae bacterium]|nr:MAG: hypothetical protein C3F11_13285 [Methylocystaceae bacterium]